MVRFEQHHPWIVSYARGLLLVAVFVGIGVLLDRSGVHAGYAGHALFLAAILSVLSTWASWEKKRRQRTAEPRFRRTR